MTSENYRQMLNNEFDSKEMSKEDFDNTLMYFAMLYHKEQSVFYNDASICECVNKSANNIGPFYKECGHCGREIK